MNVRYINNTDKDVISGAYKVPAYDQLVFDERQPVLDALVGKSLQGLIDGVEIVPEVVEVKTQPIAVPAKT